MVDIINSDADHWKEKYLSELDHLEQKEKEWRVIEEMLRQSISRLSLAADDHDTDLNYLLDRLRRSIREGTASSGLLGLINAISKRIESLDEFKLQQVTPPSAINLLMELASTINSPAGGRNHARKFLKKYGNAREEQITEMVSDFKDMLSQTLDTLREPSGQSSHRGIGLIGRLLGKDESESDTDRGVSGILAQPRIDSGQLDAAKRILNELISRLVIEAAKGNEFSSRIKSSQYERELMLLVRELGDELLRNTQGNLEPSAAALLSPNEVLIRLLERIDIPVALTNECDTIKATLTESVEGERFEPILKRIADLIQAMRVQIQQEKGELEQFLQQLTDRLQEIDSNLQLHFSINRESYEGGRTMAVEVNREITGISTSVQQASSLFDIKAVVAQRVEIIQRHMERFQQGEQERILHAEQRVEQLTQKLQAMSGESEQLRQQMAEQRHLALFDPLTEIPNRLSYNERIEIEFTRWHRYNTPLTLAIWDIDKFKSVNDTYGHQAGDRVLTVVAKLLSKKIRETDFVARFGGEEFVLLMPETKLQSALSVSDALRNSVAKTAFHFREQRVPITISCGLAQFRSGDTITAVFKRADTALYAAKHNGRNRCELEQP